MYKRDFGVAKKIFTVFLRDMNIQTFNNPYTPNFGAASDITLKYVLERRSQYLPERVLARAKELSRNPVSEQPALKDLHKDVYRSLMGANTLEEAKELYPEFAGVIDAVELEGNRSKAVKAIKKIMSLKDFTLQYLKDLYSLMTEDNIVAKYGFTNRSLLQWLNTKLHITKPMGEYNLLVKMTDEAENNRIAELSRQQVKNNPEAHLEMSRKGAATQKRPEVIEKKRAMMKEFHKNNPKYAEKTRLISQRTWAKCPEIRKALSEYTASQNDITRKTLEKRVKQRKELTENERKIISGYYKRFWATYPQYLEVYREARKEAIEELTSEGLISKF